MLDFLKRERADLGDGFQSTYIDHLTVLDYPEDPALDVGERLQSIRKLKGLSQRELAKRAGVTNSTISMIEKNSVSPSISSLRKVLGGIPMSMVEFC